MAKKDEPAITNRQINNLRAESMRYASFLLSRLRTSVLGKSTTKECVCGKEYELFPDVPVTLTAAQVNAATFEIKQVYPGLTPEDTRSVTSAIQTKEETNDSLATLITTDSVLISLLETNPKQMLQCTASLVKLTENIHDIQPTDKTSNQSHEQAQVILPSKGTIS